MSHLSIGLRTSRTRLVELVRKYREELTNSNDVFEKAELSSYLETVQTFCIHRGGWSYWYGVNDEACDRQPSFDENYEGRMIYLRH